MTAGFGALYTVELDALCCTIPHRSTYCNIFLPKFEPDFISFVAVVCYSNKRISLTRDYQTLSPFINVKVSLQLQF